MRWKFWRKPTPPEVIDLGEVEPEFLAATIMDLGVSLNDYYADEGRAAEKRAKRAAQGKPPHRIRTVSLQELRANPRASYRGMELDPPPWANTEPR